MSSPKLPEPTNRAHHDVLLRGAQRNYGQAAAFNVRGRDPMIPDEEGGPFTRGAEMSIDDSAGNSAWN
jgi:hypothetical protein